MKIVTILGARPQFIKAAPVSRAIIQSNLRAEGEEQKIAEVLVHTGQHYDREMSDVFFEALNLAPPQYNLQVGSGSHGTQLAKMIQGLEVVLKTEEPSCVIVYGDTNSTLAGALVADRLHIKIAHVEAGLRSYNRQMPEEANRLLTDHLSSLLFAPTKTAVENLKREGITQGVYLVGDVMYEAAVQNLEIAERESTVLERESLVRKGYCLATVHRAENTDEPSRLENIVSALTEISRKEPVIWPVHPRTGRILSSPRFRGLAATNLRMIDPVPYFDMLMLANSARVILTDSGGVQKEAMWFCVPCVTLRNETEWIETVETGWNRIAGSNKDDILTAFEKAVSGSQRKIESTSRKLAASRQIVDHLLQFEHRSLSATECCHS